MIKNTSSHNYVFTYYNFKMRFITIFVCAPLPSPSFGRLPAQYLDRIGQLFFGVPPKQSPSYGGLLGKWILDIVNHSLFDFL